MKLMKMTLEDIYLDWVNNFISIEGFCEYYNITKAQAVDLLFFIKLIEHENKV